MRRDPSSVLPVAPLDDGGVDRMVTSCLATSTPPPEVGAFLRAHSEGIPLVVEELLAGLVTAGELRLEQGRWSSPGELTAHVPASLRESVARRLATLDPVDPPGGRRRRGAGTAVRLGAAARDRRRRRARRGRRVAGRWSTGSSSRSTATVSRSGTRSPVRRSSTTCCRPTVGELARRARPAVERANPGLPGTLLRARGRAGRGRRGPRGGRVPPGREHSTRPGRRGGGQRRDHRAARPPPRRRRRGGASRRRRGRRGRPRRRRQAPGGARDRAGPGEPAGRRRGGAGAARRRSCSPWPAPPSAPGTCPARWATSRRHGPRRTAHVDDALAARITAVDAHVALEQGRAGDAETLARRGGGRRRRHRAARRRVRGLEVLGRIARDLGPGASTAMARARRASRGAGAGSPPGTCGPGTSWP